MQTNASIVEQTEGNLSFAISCKRKRSSWNWSFTSKSRIGCKAPVTPQKIKVSSRFSNHITQRHDARWKPRPRMSWVTSVDSTRKQLLLASPCISVSQTQQTETIPQIQVGRRRRKRCEHQFINKPWYEIEDRWEKRSQDETQDDSDFRNESDKEWRAYHEEYKICGIDCR